ncbi:DoxX family protein [Croceitalea rosinachiae]|uniref:DoxX family protein n=1 Tax=Croceitalea rosinachiae TaxID=3075596 RepID=A0ABU3A813_9FLAO|nr:DoxX family protein [Croceitalea sp. F388]MDT0606326.1 DoxX family protein [Croceitalea sp. F388]
MEYITIIIKVFIFFSIVNVWFLRFNKPTSWRGGQATNMKKEFEIYGLSETMLYLVGGLKVLAATLLLVSIWVPQLTLPASAIIAILMAGAIAMHNKVKDPLRRSFPAFAFLVLSIVLILSNIL